jgi:DNA-binding transcriptional ArsR family regulator/precorrin-6B methylase 2
MRYKDMFISPKQKLGIDRLAGALSAAGEPTRLRILALLAQGEMAVGELALALGQSQPRVSRHLRLMTEAGLVERLPEGAWVFYRLSAAPAERGLVQAALAGADPDDPTLRRDAARLAEIRAARDAAAEAYFAENAANWDRVRALHLPDADIEAAILRAAGEGPFELMIDVGVGAGRMIELFADRVRRAEGFDTSRQMLAVARAKLDELPEAKAAVRFGDAYDPPAQPASADLVTIHHVLHFLHDPARAIAQAVRLLKPGGRLVIADFAPHELEFLRRAHAHRRLGFSDADIASWCAAAGAPVIACATLAPKARSQEALIVKVWTAERPGEPHRKRAAGAASKSSARQKEIAA